jgi:hypothetical protein
MSTQAKSKWVNVFTLVVLFLTTFQGLIPALPMGNIPVISGVVMFAVSALTAWKQYLSIEIDNSSLWPTLVVAFIATLGGLNDLFSVIQLSEATGQWVRFGITLVTAFLNLASKILYPTTETKSSV